MRFKKSALVISMMIFATSAAYAGKVSDLTSGDVDVTFTEPNDPVTLTLTAVGGLKSGAVAENTGIATFNIDLSGDAKKLAIAPSTTTRILGQSVSYGKSDSNHKLYWKIKDDAANWENASATDSKLYWKATKNAVNTASGEVVTGILSAKDVPADTYNIQLTAATFTD